MARGRLTDASITAVRETARIDQVVSTYVTLKRAGAGSMKGLCPFHDEKSPSFHVTPDRGFFTCFGCNERGDVISFVQKIENLDFIEAIERLAEQFRVDLTYEDSATPGADANRTESRAVRARLIAANTAAADFYASQLLTPEATEARRFLSERGFDRHAAAEFGCGYAPNAWDVLIKHLSGLGFTPDEITTAGLVSEGRNGPIDRFRGRLMFPIRDQSGDVIGFGARKLLPDDQDKGPKYLNTSETPIYKKSRVLFGLDKARKAIAKSRRVVVVEGYTDVMACYLSGEETAVATCGTAFGEEHIRIIRRLLGDDGTGGEVIYTFDGDKAGQKAALRAFTMDDHFQTRTSVAVEPDGMDPCEVRIARGPDGVRALLDDRIPLFEFAIKTTLSQFDLGTPEGRSNALSAVAPILSGLKHQEMRDGYIRQLSRWTGTEQALIRDTVLRTTPSTTGITAPPTPTAPETRSEEAIHDDRFPRPEPSYAPNARDALKVVLHNPKQTQLASSELHRSDFAHPTHRAAWDAVLAAHTEATTSLDASEWVHRVIAHAPAPSVVALVTELSVEPFRGPQGITHDAALSVFLRVVQESVQRRIDRIERAIADPGLATDQMLAMLDDLAKLRDRHAAAEDRLNQILLGTHR